MDKKEDIFQKPMPQRSGNTGQGKYLPDPLKEMKKKKQGETTSKAEVYEEQAPAEKDFLVSLDNLDNF